MSKTLSRPAMMAWVSKHMKFVRPTECFNGNEGGLWLSAENLDEFDGPPMYNYGCMDQEVYDGLGVLQAWEEAVQARGWYSEWYDPGTVMLWPLGDCVSIFSEIEAIDFNQYPALHEKVLDYLGVESIYDYDFNQISSMEMEELLEMLNTKS